MTASLGGNTCTHARLQIPKWGRAWADVELAEAVVLAGRQTLTIAEATYAMTITSGGVTDDARARYRLVAGNGGWGTNLPPRAGYQSDAGIPASLVIRDAARDCGEQVGTLPTATLGPHYTREVGLASAIINYLAPQSWYVDAAGITQFGARATSSYGGQGTRTRVDPAAGVVELAVDEVANLQPGVVVDGITALDIEIEVTPQRITARVYGAGAASDCSGALADLVRALFPDIRYRGVHEFRVVMQAGDKLHLQPARVAKGMCDLTFVPVRLAPGVKAQHSLGSLVLVAFADADPSRPQVISGDAPDSPGWMPLTLEFGETPTLGVARQTDAVVAGPFAGSIVGGSVRIKSGL